LYGHELSEGYGLVGLVVAGAGLGTLFMDRIGRKFTIVPSFVIIGVGLALLPLIDGYESLLLVVSLIGFGHGLGSGLC